MAEPEPAHPISTLEWVQSLGQGETVADLYLAVTRVVSEIVAKGGKGSVTLKLSIVRKKTGEIEIDEVISEHAPDAAPRGSIYWYANAGLHRTDPRQTALPGFSIYRRQPVTEDTLGEEEG